MNSPEKEKGKWFNLPYCKSVRKNFGKKILQIVNKYLGDNSKFKKYLNKNNIKLSYCGLLNIETIMKNLNKKLTSSNKNSKDGTRNCRDKEKYLLKDGKCRSKNAIYQATIKTSNETKLYIDLKTNPLKRVATHRTTTNSKL